MFTYSNEDLPRLWSDSSIVEIFVYCMNELIVKYKVATSHNIELCLVIA